MKNWGSYTRAITVFITSSYVIARETVWLRISLWVLWKERRSCYVTPVMVAKFLDDNERKRHLKSEFALFETLSILFNFISLVKCWRHVQKSVMHLQSCCFANIGPVYMEVGVIPPSRGALCQDYWMVAKHVNKKKGRQTTCFSDYCSSTFTCCSCCNLQCCSVLYCYR